MFLEIIIVILLFFSLDFQFIKTICFALAPLPPPPTPRLPLLFAGRAV